MRGTWYRHCWRYQRHVPRQPCYYRLGLTHRLGLPFAPCVVRRASCVVRCVQSCLSCPVQSSPVLSGPVQSSPVVRRASSAGQTKNPIQGSGAQRKAVNRRPPTVRFPLLRHSSHSSSLTPLFSLFPLEHQQLTHVPFLHTHIHTHTRAHTNTHTPVPLFLSIPLHFYHLAISSLVLEAALTL